MDKGLEQAIKNLLGRSGYSDKAADEVWKWYNVRATANSERAV